VGDDVEEAHMRNRQMICKWVLERAKPSGAIQELSRDGKTFFKIFDYDQVRKLFGEMLREVQRIKSQGDGPAAERMVETFGVKIDPELHKQVLERKSKYKVWSYSGFVNPRLVPVTEGAEIVDVKVEYPDNFVQQHLEYSKLYTIREN
jgi:dipeptidyl-peptidase-3